MTNKLKILLCTVCYVLVFDNYGYSMFNQNNIIPSQNDLINNINIDNIKGKNGCDALSFQVKEMQSKNLAIPDKSNTYNNFDSINKIITINPSVFDLHEQDQIQKYIAQNYTQFCTNKYNENSIKKLVNVLLQNSITFVTKYSDTFQLGIDEQNSSYKLFNIAWYILYKYVVDNEFELLKNKIELLYDNFLNKFKIYPIKYNLQQNKQYKNEIKEDPEEYHKIIETLLKSECINAILKEPIKNWDNISLGEYAIKNYLKFVNHHSISAKTLIDNLYTETLNYYNKYKYSNYWHEIVKVCELVWSTLIQYMYNKSLKDPNYNISQIYEMIYKLGKMNINLPYADWIEEFITLDTDITTIENYIKYLKELPIQNKRIMMSPYLYNKYRGLHNVINSVTDTKPIASNYSYLDGCHKKKKKRLFYYEHHNTYAQQFMIDYKDFMKKVEFYNYDKEDFTNLANNLLRNTLSSITENSYRKDWIFTAAWNILIKYLKMSKYTDLHNKILDLYKLLVSNKVLDTEHEFTLIDKYDNNGETNKLMRIIMFSPNTTIQELATNMYNKGINSKKIINKNECLKQYKSLSNIVNLNILENNKLLKDEKLLCNNRIFESILNDNINNNYTQNYESNNNNNDYGQHEDSIINYLQMSKIQLLANNLLKDNLLFLKNYDVNKNLESYKLFNIAWNILLEYARVFRLDMYNELLQLINQLQNYINIKINSDIFKKFYNEEKINEVINLTRDINTNINNAVKLAEELRKNRNTLKSHLTEAKVKNEDIDKYEQGIASKIIFNRFDGLKTILHNVKRYNSKKDYYHNILNIYSTCMQNFEKDMQYFYKNNDKQKCMHIIYCINLLLRDNLSFIAKYSSTSSNYYLFSIAWNILFKYIDKYKINIKNLEKLKNTFNIAIISDY